MSVTQILADLRQRNITVRAKGDDLCVTADKGSLSPELRALLADHKQEIVRYLRQLDEGGPAEIIPVADRGSRLPLSFGQHRLWFLDQIEPGSSTYVIPAAVRIQGHLEAETLVRALDQVVQRHEVLRTVFVTEEGHSTQVILAQMAVPFAIVDLRQHPPADQESMLERWLRREAQKPFDLTAGPLLRAALLQVAEQEHVLMFTLHHIVADGWSIGILIRELSAFYTACQTGRPAELPPLPVQYADYAVWQRRWMESPMRDRQLAYWRTQLAHLTPLTLPTDHPRPDHRSHQGASSLFVVPSELAGRLRLLGLQEEATLFMVLLAAFQVLLGRYSGQQQIAVGTPVANRRSREIEGLIGFFVNTLVLFSDLKGSPGFRQFLRKVRKTTQEAYDNQDLPFEQLVDDLQPARSVNQNPLFQVMLAYQQNSERSLRIPGLSLRPLNVDTQTAKFDLTMTVSDDGGELQGSVVYNADLFEPATMARMMEHYCVLLSGIARDPEQSIAAAPLLAEAERRQLLVEWNNTAADFPETCIHELFEDQAARTPAAVALEYKGRKLTYAELDRRTNQLARRLRRLGIGPEMRVGICMERGLELVVGLIGILKSGGAYVPLDPDYPPDRLAYMMEDSLATVLLTEEKLLSLLPSYSGRVLRLDAQREEIGRESSAGLERIVQPENISYLIYTSGSTGRPKGVAIRHSSATAFVDGARRVFSAEDLGGVLASISICFDLSVFEIFVPLSCGGKSIIVDNILDLATTAEAEKVRLVTAVPSAMRELVRAKAVPVSVRTINLGGEALPRWLVDEIYQFGNVDRVFNLYGPSEHTTYSTYALVPRGRENMTVPIGRPAPNTKLYVLDEFMEPVPIGMAGELYIGGAGLARGYLGRPELTAEKFVPNPFAGGTAERLYRTGDRVRYLPDANLDFLGRMDHQVKIRGYRVELGEIEEMLLRETGFEQAVVVVREDAQGDKQLVAYIISPEEIRAGEVREKLKQRLPDYMLPSMFVRRESMPLTPSGKVDRLALSRAALGERSHERTYVAPRTTKEEVLARIWTELLKVERIGIHDNFFELGGHSLLLFRLKAMIQNRLDCDLPLSSLFQDPTIAGLAELLEVPVREPSSPILVAMQVKGTRAPFFCVHPVGGQVLCYAHLSRELGQNQPFYALQSPDPCQTPVATIEEMAGLYIREIRRIEPHGPYLLGGWSMGGLVAFEMAHQLMDEGESIGLLALFDTFPPAPYLGGAERYENVPILERFASDMSRLVLNNADDLREQFLQLRPQEQLNLMLDVLVREEVLPQGSGQSELNRLLDIFTRNSMAMDNYRLRPAKQRIVLFPAAGREAPEGLAEKWEAWAAGGMELRPVPGDHYTILKPPRVSTIASILTHYFDNADRARAQNF